MIQVIAWALSFAGVYWAFGQSGWWGVAGLFVIAIVALVITRLVTGDWPDPGC